MALLIFGGGPKATRGGGGRRRHSPRSSGLRGWLRRAAIYSLTLLLVVCGGTASPASPSIPATSASEYQIKAAFLYNFAKFIEWPAEVFHGAGTPMVIGIVGDDPFGSILDQTVNGKTANGRELVVRRFKSHQDLNACHILFISPSEKKRLPQILERLKGTSVLTISEVDHFAQHGGIINFVMEGNKVHFEINVDMAERARLKISAKLLTLARVVRGESPGGKS